MVKLIYEFFLKKIKILKIFFVILALFFSTKVFGIGCDLFRGSAKGDYGNINIILNSGNYCPYGYSYTTIPDGKYFFYSTSTLIKHIILKIDSLTIDIQNCPNNVFWGDKGLFENFNKLGIKCLIPFKEVNTDVQRYVEGEIIDVSTQKDLLPSLKEFFKRISNACSSTKVTTKVTTSSGPFYLSIDLSKFYKGNSDSFDGLKYESGIDGKFKVGEENAYCWFDYSGICTYYITSNNTTSCDVTVFRDNIKIATTTGCVPGTIGSENGSDPGAHRRANYYLDASFKENNLPQKYFNIIDKNNFSKSLPIVPTFYLMDSQTLNVDLKYFYNYKYILPDEIFHPAFSTTEENCSISVGRQEEGESETMGRSSQKYYSFTVEGRGSLSGIFYYNLASSTNISLNETASTTSIGTISIEGLSDIAFNLKATPVEGNEFLGWEGFCNITTSTIASTTNPFSPTSTACSAKFTSNYEFTIFSLPNGFNVTVYKDGETDEKINCSGENNNVTGTCSNYFPKDSTLNINISRESGSSSDWRWGGACSNFPTSTYNIITTINRDMACNIYYPSSQDSQDSKGPQIYQKGGKSNTSQLPHFKNVPKLLKIIKNKFNSFLLSLIKTTQERIKEILAVGEEGESLNPHVLPPLLTIELFDEDSKKMITSTRVDLIATSVSFVHDFYGDLITSTEAELKVGSKEYSLIFKLDGNSLKIPFILSGNDLNDVVLAGMNCGGIYENRKPEPKPQLPSPYFTYKRICLTNNGDVGSDLRVYFSNYITTSTFPEELFQWANYFSYQKREGVSKIGSGKWWDTFPVDRWVNNTTTLNEDIKLFDKITKIGVNKEDTIPVNPNVIFSFPNVCYFDSQGCEGRIKYATYTLVFKGKAVKENNNEEEIEEEITKENYSSSTKIDIPLKYIPPPPKINLSIGEKYERQIVKSADVRDYFIYAVSTTEKFVPFQQDITYNPFYGLNDNDLCKVSFTTSTDKEIDITEDIIKKVTSTLSSTSSDLFISNNMLKVKLLRYLIIPSENEEVVINSENEMFKLTELQNLFGLSTKINGNGYLTKNLFKDIIIDKDNNAFNGDFLEIKFTCHQDWDNDGYQNNTSSLDMVQESVTIKPLPPTAVLIPTNVAQYTGTGEQLKTASFIAKIHITDATTTSEVRLIIKPIDRPVTTTISYVKEGHSSSTTASINSGEEKNIRIGNARNGKFIVNNMNIKFEYKEETEVEIKISYKEKRGRDITDGYTINLR